VNEAHRQEIPHNEIVSAFYSYNSPCAGAKEHNFLRYSSLLIQMLNMQIKHCLHQTEQILISLIIWERITLCGEQ